MDLNCKNIKLQQGSKGDNVRQLQQALKTLKFYTTYKGNPLLIDGSYGPHTVNAVKNFQRLYKLRDTGQINETTCNKIKTVLATQNAISQEKKKEANKQLEKDNKFREQLYETVKPDYLKTFLYKLNVLPDMVVLPTLEAENEVAPGNVSTSADFDCSKVNIRKGSSGDDVKKLQTILKARGYYSGRIDGDCGKYTVGAIKTLQRNQGNTADGVFGPKTCNKLQTSNNKDNKDGSSIAKKAPFEIINIKENPSISMDLDGLSEEVTLQVLYSPEVLMKVKQYQKTEFKVFLGVDEVYKHEGYINTVKVSSDNGQLFIELSIVGYTAFLETTIEVDKTAKRSELIKFIAETTTLKSNVDMTGLEDSEYTLKSTQESTSAGSAEGKGATMTIDEIYKIAATFSYVHQGTGLSPEKAYNLYQNGTRGFDCYDATNWLCYMISHFAKRKVRNVQTYSPYSRSKTHRVAQIMENGEWVCPKQAWNMNKLLKPFTPWNHYGQVREMYVLEPQ